MTALRGPFAALLSKVAQVLGGARRKPADGLIASYERSGATCPPPDLLKSLLRRGDVHSFPSGRFHLVVGHEVARGVLANAGGFSSAPSAGMDAVLLAADPEHHPRIRGEVGRALLADPASWRRAASDAAAETADALLTGSVIDAVAQYATPVAELSMARIMGLSDPELRDVVAIVEQDRYGLVYVPELQTYFAEHAAHIATRPNSFSARLLSGAGNVIAPEDVPSLLTLCWAAGTLTTAALVPLAIKNLIRHVDDRATIWAERNRIDGIVEETLRRETPLQDVWRSATRPCKVAGQEIGGNALVKVSLAATGLDPNVYSNPEAFDPARGAQHLAFGHGAHMCLGAGLARTISREALVALCRRFPQVADANPDAALAYAPSEHFRALARYPVALGNAAS